MDGHEHQHQRQAVARDQERLLRLARLHSAGHFATIAWLSRQLGEADWERMWEVDRQNARCHAR